MVDRQLNTGQFFCSVRPADAVVQLPKNLGVSKLVVEYKKSGEPRLIRNSALVIQKYLERLESAYGVILAPYISELETPVFLLTPPVVNPRPCLHQSVQ